MCIYSRALPSFFLYLPQSLSTTKYQTEKPWILRLSRIVQKIVKEASELIKCFLHIHICAPNDGAVQGTAIAGGVGIR